MLEQEVYPFSFSRVIHVSKKLSTQCLRDTPPPFQQVGFVARSVAVSSILGVLLLNLVPLCTASVLGVWVAMKAMMVLRLGSASARLLSRQSPLYVQPAHS